jgi:hypothetical protein
MTEVTAPSPSHPSVPDFLTTILLGHNAFQFFRAGVELGLFELLERSPGIPREQIGKDLELSERALDILLLGTTALHLTEHDPLGYRNHPALSALFTDGHWDLVTAVVGFEAYITYPGVADFTEALRANSNVGLRRYPADVQDPAGGAETTVAGEVATGDGRPGAHEVVKHLEQARVRTEPVVDGGAIAGVAP